MTPLYLSRPLFFLAVLLALSPLGASRPAMAQLDPPPPTQRLPIHPGSAADEEELDLGARASTAESAPAPSDCEPTLPSGAPVGVRGSAAPGACLSKQWAKTQSALAYAVHDQLWCSDPGSQKLLARQQAMLRDASHRESSALREAWELSGKKNHTQLGSLGGYAELLKAQAQALAPRPSAPPMPPHYDPSQERSLWWDAREAEKCKNWQSSGPELGPSLSARGAGKIVASSGACDALLVEANLVSGRHGLSRISWLASKCEGFSSPDPALIARALAAGPAQAQAWQDQHFRSWRWQGFDPRPAKARSADGFLRD